MSLYWNHRVKRLAPYIPGEQIRDQRVIKLNTNENPYPPSPKVIEAIQKALGDDLRLYPDPACTELRTVIAQRYGVMPEQVFAGNGSDEVLAFAFAAFFESAAENRQTLPILFPDITYSFYPVYTRLWDIPFTPVPLAADFSLVIEDYKQAAGGVVIPNPNAPTGQAISRSDLRSLLAFHEKNRETAAVVLVDEAYTAFGRDLEVTPLVHEYSNLLTVHTLSKAASLAGLRVGFAIGNQELIEGLGRVRDSFNSYTVDRLAQAGARAAILDASYYEAVNRKVIATRNRVSAALQALGYEVIPSQANFIFIRSLQKNGMQLYAFLREQDILVRHFNQLRIADFLRVSIGTDEQMDRVLAACETFSNGT